MTHDKKTARGSQSKRAAESAARTELIDEFKALVMPHAQMVEVRNQALSVLASSAGPKILAIAGPTGVGKSTLGRELVRSLRMRLKDDYESHPDAIPIIWGNAVAPTRNAFSWEDFFTRILGRCNEALIEKKIIVPHAEGLFRRFQLDGGDAMKVDKLRRATESCLRHRRTKVILIDEAHHLLMVKGADKQELQFETLKSLANETEARIVLLGTYRLLDIQNHSAQLVRRSEIIQFRRYDLQIAEDVDDFASAISYCLERAPVKYSKDIIANTQWMMMMSVGCIGNAKEWLTKALELALAAKQPLGMHHLEATARGPSALKTMYEEALLGERMMEQMPIEDLHQLAYSKTPEVRKPPPVKAKAAKPGVRKPTRDPVGSRHAA